MTEPTTLPADPESLGLDPARVRRLEATLARWTSDGTPPAVAVCVGRREAALTPRFFGRHDPALPAPIRPDAVFLIASITKPVVVSAAMLLVERGALGLDDPVVEYVHEFAPFDKAEVRIRHLMTHTSGLPDMLPDNLALRKAHSPLARFVSGTCAQPLLFPPGTRVRYQSMGTLMLAEVVQRLTQTPLPEFLDREIFQPLGMRDSALGLARRPDLRPRVAAVRVEPEMAGSDWGWNSDYWRDLGAPWGGMLSTPADLARLAQCFLNGGTLGGTRVFSPATVRAMTTNQLAGFPELPEDDRRCRPWGLGWRLHWPCRSANFGDLLGPRTYGHWGATGTVLWIDPDLEAFAVVLTTEPAGDEGRYLARACNLIAALF